MLPLALALLACTVDPAPPSGEEGGRGKRGKRGAAEEQEPVAVAPEQAEELAGFDPEQDGDGFPIALLGVDSTMAPRGLGLRPDPVAPNEFLLDGRQFEWAGPPLTDGRISYGQAGIRRGSLRTAGRARCAALTAYVEGLYGEPSVDVCGEKHWQTATHGVRYHEDPSLAQCAASFVVDEAFEVPQPAGAGLESGAWGGVKLGTPRAQVAGLAPILGRDGQPTAEWAGPPPALAGVAAHGVRYAFWEEALAEVQVRSSAEGCDALRAALVASFGPGREFEPGPGVMTPATTGLDWSGCAAVALYRYDPLYQACFVTWGAREAQWQRAEAMLSTGNPDVRAAQAEIAQFVVDEGGVLVVTEGVADWMARHPEFGSAPPQREFGSVLGKGEGVRLVGVGRETLEYALGLRDRDVLLTINGQSAEKFQATPDLLRLVLKVRRQGEELPLTIGFDAGVYAKIQAVRPVFP